MPNTEPPLRHSPDDNGQHEALTPPLIFSYTRAQAIVDGVLIDVTLVAKEAGFRIPVALTAAVWSEYVRVPVGVDGQDEAGRLWDVLNMLRFGIRSNSGDSSELHFQLHVRNNNSDGDAPLVTLKAICGPNDDGSPCLTVLLPQED